MLTSLCKYKDINKPSAFSYLADICPHMFSKYFGEIILFFFFFFARDPFPVLLFKFSYRKDFYQITDLKQEWLN